MMKYWLSSLFLLVVLACGAMSLFIVPEGMQARASSDQPWLSPGLHFHWPLASSLQWRDQRQQLLVANGSNEQPYISVKTFDQKSLQLGYMALWHVANEILYTKQVGSTALAASQVRAAINEVLSQCCLGQTLAQWLNQRSIATIEQQTLTAVNLNLKAKGLQLSQLQVTALIVPSADRELWLDGMRLRGQGALDQLQVQTSTLAADLRSQVDAEVTQTLATAQKQAEQLRAQADIQATAVYAEAYHKSPDFYEFYTNLQTYQRLFKAKPPVLVLGSDSPFLKSLDDGASK